jgi:hypothetical protein
MIPAYFIPLPGFFDPHGKVDRRALPAAGVQYRWGLYRAVYAGAKYIGRNMVRVLTIPRDKISIHADFQFGWSFTEGRHGREKI